MKLPAAWPPDRDALRRDGLALFAKLIRTKNIEGPSQAHQAEHQQQNKLTKCLTTLDLTSLGVGSCVGTGMYLVAGMVARNMAGPGVIVSFIIAAVASIFSGACYAEFGVRVPHTSGSAYTYSYVTVGEFIAFVIGWNMVLEYLIGTSACARALSACVDALADGALSRAVKDSMGQLPADGGPPDPLAACITLLMMALLAAGVRKSLLFNNVLNAVNLAAWVFAMTVGMFYMDTANWTQHGGFLPQGWSGVLTGAATCFYAFIGFDIIATTGEEANNPKRSIPLAIVGSLIIVLAAYVTSSALLTLVVPYDKLDESSALVELFGQVGARRCKYVVAVGALAGLTVSMFGSMFPMPRILYAMAQDGLIYRMLAQIWPSTGTPTVATFGSGVAAAVVALLIRLDVLVEMMSIGTLLAYTLVSTCVLILRYQPHSTNLVELLPQSLRTPLRGSPVKEAPAVPGAPNGGAFGPQDDRALRPDALRHALDATAAGQQQRVMVRRVTRSSPDSDDTFGGDEPEEEFSMRDDQFLVSDRTENKFYGSLHGAGSAQSTGGATVPGAASLGYLGRRLHAATYLCPAIFPWVDTGPATDESGMYVMKAVGLLYLLIIIFDLTIVFGMYDVGTGISIFVALLLIAIVVVLLAISRKPQNRSALIFMTPGLPFVPAIAVTVNIYLILKLSILTLVRFTVWMTVGLVVYFHYGIRHSSLEEGATAENGIELTVTEHEPPNATATLAKPQDTHHGGTFQSDWDPNTMWEQSNDAASVPPQQQQYRGHQQQPPPAPARPAAPNSTFSTLFVSETAFPTWDD